MRQLFFTKCNKSLLPILADVLLQNAIAFLQNATFITECDNLITKCVSTVCDFCH